VLKTLSLHKHALNIPFIYDEITSRRGTGLHSSPDYSGKKNVRANETTLHQKNKLNEFQLNGHELTQKTCCKNETCYPSHVLAEQKRSRLVRRSFVALATDDLEMLVSCARRLSDFSGVCCN
jgi:hypothetical protein